jgi:hypothetical protein
MTITPQIAISEIIGKKEDDVGRRLRAYPKTPNLA